MRVGDGAGDVDRRGRDDGAGRGRGDGKGRRGAVAFDREGEGRRVAGLVGRDELEGARTVGESERSGAEGVAGERRRPPVDGDCGCAGDDAGDRELGGRDQRARLRLGADESRGRGVDAEADGDGGRRAAGVGGDHREQVLAVGGDHRARDERRAVEGRLGGDRGRVLGLDHRGDRPVEQGAVGERRSALEQAHDRRLGVESDLERDLGGVADRVDGAHRDRVRSRDEIERGEHPDRAADARRLAVDGDGGEARVDRGARDGDRGRADHRARRGRLDGELGGGSVAHDPVQPLGRVAGGVGRDQQEGAFPLGEGERSGGEEIARERRGGAVDGDGLGPGDFAREGDRPLGGDAAVGRQHRQEDRSGAVDGEMNGRRGAAAGGVAG